MRILHHTAVVVLALLLIVGVPVYKTGYIQEHLSHEDSVSSPTTILEQPSGAYVVLINRDRHQNAENLAVWESFFRGEEIDYLFEDITCSVAKDDAVGLELARSMQSRLPENQMKVKPEETIIMFSKIDCGHYDVVLLSREFYDFCDIGETDLGSRTDVIEAEGV